MDSPGFSFFSINQSGYKEGSSQVPQQYYTNFDTQPHTPTHIILNIERLIALIQAKLDFVIQRIFQYDHNPHTYQQTLRCNDISSHKIRQTIIRKCSSSYDEEIRTKLLSLFKTYRDLETKFNYYNQELFNQNSLFTYDPRFYLLGGSTLFQGIDTYKPVFQELDSLLEQCLNSFKSIN